jgi:hypothetical protein
MMSVAKETRDISLKTRHISFSRSWSRQPTFLIGELAEEISARCKDIFPKDKSYIVTKRDLYYRQG